MKKIVHVIIFLSINFYSFGQDKIDEITKPIVDEGKRLYKSEMASWYGTDIFIEQFKDQEKIGGYLSYFENNIAKCIFFSKGEDPNVIGTISFDSTYNVETAKSDLSERKFTPSEYDLYSIRLNALKAIKSDTLFKIYKNTSLNLIPLIANGEKKVYVLTGTGQIGMVIFGNDYLLTFNNENQVINRKRLHTNIIVVNYGEKMEDGKEIVGAVHSHLPETGDFITSTDICTLMLYEKLAKWKSHTVVSANYISIWNCETDVLITIRK